MAPPLDHDAPAEETEGSLGIGGGRRDPALTDAEAVLHRLERDESAARELRERLRGGRIAAIAADTTISPLLQPGEELLATRSSAVLNRSEKTGPLPGYGGALYVTSRRLLHVGKLLVAIPLDAIGELSLAGERLQITLLGGEGLTLDVDRPRVLRVEIAASMAQLREPGTAASE